MALTGVDPWVLPLHRFISAYLLWMRRALTTYDPKTGQNQDKWVQFRSELYRRPPGVTTRAASGDPDGFLAFEASLSAK